MWHLVLRLLGVHEMLPNTASIQHYPSWRPAAAAAHALGMGSTHPQGAGCTVNINPQPCTTRRSASCGRHMDTWHPWRHMHVYTWVPRYRWPGTGGTSPAASTRRLLHACCCLAGGEGGAGGTWCEQQQNHCACSATPRHVRQKHTSSHCMHTLCSTAAARPPRLADKREGAGSDL